MGKGGQPKAVRPFCAIIPVCTAEKDGQGHNESAWTGRSFWDGLRRGVFWRLRRVLLESGRPINSGERCQRSRADAPRDRPHQRHRLSDSLPRPPRPAIRHSVTSRASEPHRNCSRNLVWGTVERLRPNYIRNGRQAGSRCTRRSERGRRTALDRMLRKLLFHSSWQLLR